MRSVAGSMTSGFDHPQTDRYPAAIPEGYLLTGVGIVRATSHSDDVTIC